MRRRSLRVRVGRTVLVSLLLALAVLVPSIEAARYPVRNRTRSFYERAMTRSHSSARTTRYHTAISKGQLVSQSR